MVISKDKQMRFLFHEDDRQMQLSPKIVKKMCNQK
jgi:hypothetical protein